MSRSVRSLLSMPQRVCKSSSSSAPHFIRPSPSISCASLIRRSPMLPSAPTKLQPSRSMSFFSKIASKPTTAPSAPAASAAATSTTSSSKNAMFCFQCEQTNNGTGCTTVGVCGKSPNTATLQNIIEYLSRSMSLYIDAIQQVQPSLLKDHESGRVEVDRWFLHSLFSTMTNVNFDDSRMLLEIQQGIALRSQLQHLFEAACRFRQLDPKHELEQRQLANNMWVATPVPCSTTSPDSISQLVSWARSTPLCIDVRRTVMNPDVVGLQELIMYSLKGIAAYATHADVMTQLVERDENIVKDMWAALATSVRSSSSVDDLVGAVLLCGNINLRVMKELDSAHRGMFGVPAPNQVNCKPVPGKALLVSGHDMKDLEEILKQCEGKGVNVYTHGEMLPAHSYPKLKQYKHLVGHYGGPWQLQKFEFASFPGSIVMTSNCLVEPLKSYRGRIFTRGPTGFSGITHLPTHDYTPAIDAALKADGFAEGNDEDKKLCSRPDVTVGFGHEVILSLADKIIHGVKQGQIKRFFYIGGCDGSEGERSYFSDLAAATPSDTIILTAGCGKFRVNRQPALRSAVIDVNGTKIPRVLDLGQCNDSYSAIVVADALRQAFGLKHVNELPLSFAVSWFEQKAVAILTTLLHLGVQNIHIGPNLPGFATPNMLKLLVDKFNLQKTNHKDVNGDLVKMQAGL